MGNLPDRNQFTNLKTNNGPAAREGGGGRDTGSGGQGGGREGMAPASVSLEQILDLEKIEVWTYRGFSFHPGSTRAFGGLVAGQALVAAGRTVPDDRRVHSLHAYFLRPGG